MKILLIPDNPLNEIDSLVDIQEKQSKKLKDSRIISMISLVLMLYTCIVGNYPLSPDIEIRSCFELMEAFLVKIKRSKLVIFKLPLSNICFKRSLYFLFSILYAIRFI